jgi:hypothetical protein
MSARATCLGFACAAALLAAAVVPARAADECSAAMHHVERISTSLRACRLDQDCVLSTEFGCPFGCQEAFNKDADLTPMRAAVAACAPLIECEACVDPPAAAVCRQGACTVAYPDAAHAR